jgi:phosphate acetyltransferase
MNFIEQIKKRAKNEIKTIVLPEASDLRTITATAKVLSEGYANVILLGNEASIKKMAKENSLDISKAKIIDPKNSDKHIEYAEKLFELRKEKGMTIEQANNLVEDEVYFGMMMVKLNEADRISVWRYSFNIRYFKTCITNFKNCSRNKTCISIFCYGSTKL